MTALAGGFLLGFLDFVWIKFVPYPFAELGNSAAVWAVAAFFFTYVVRAGYARGMIGAIALLVVAVPSYYLAAALIQHDDFANMYNTNAILWMAFGVLAGCVFGAAGVLARTSGTWRAAGIAMPAAIMLAEAALNVRRAGSPNHGHEPLWTALIEVAIGLLVTTAIAPTWRLRGPALLLAVPLAAVGVALFSTANFG